MTANVHTYVGHLSMYVLVNSIRGRTRASAEFIALDTNLTTGLLKDFAVLLWSKLADSSNLW